MANRAIHTCKIIGNEKLNSQIVYAKCNFTKFCTPVRHTGQLKLLFWTNNVLIHCKQQQCPHGITALSDSAVVQTGHLCFGDESVDVDVADVVGCGDVLVGPVVVTAAAAARLDGKSRRRLRLVEPGTGTEVSVAAVSCWKFRRFDFRPFEFSAFWFSAFWFFGLMNFRPFEFRPYDFRPVDFSAFWFRPFDFRPFDFRPYVGGPIRLWWLWTITREPHAGLSSNLTGSNIVVSCAFEP